MKKILIAFFSVILTLLCCYNETNAQCVKDEVSGELINPYTGGKCNNTILTAVPFLRITPDARSGAMGDAGIAISADANSMHYNASKLVFAEQKTALSATYTPWLRALGLQDVYLAYASGYYQIDKLQTVGLGVRFFSLGEINFTDFNGQPTGTGRPREFEITGAYARKLSDKLSASVSAKFIYSNLAAGQFVEGTEITAGFAGAADIGLTYRTPLKFGDKKSDLAIGAAFTNIGSKIIYGEQADYIPANLGIGAAWTINMDDFNSITITTDINKLLVITPPATDSLRRIDENGINGPDWKEVGAIPGVFKSFGDGENANEELRELMYSIGFEYWYDKQFAVRAGYFHEDRTKGNRKYFTVGLGLKYNVFGINLSYLVPTTNQRNPLDNTLRFSLLFDFANSDGSEE